MTVLSRGAGGVFEGASAVMSHRREPGTSLDFFPTPPWATRALAEHVLGGDIGLAAHPAPAPLPASAGVERLSAWDPCDGDRHMSAVLAEYFATVHASDVHDYGHGARVGSFAGDGPDVLLLPPGPVAWTIFNPPFNLALDFVERGLGVASDGCAALVRSVWAEGGERYARLFWHRPPTLIAQFCERVNMCKGRWDPDGSTATSYAWFVWAKAYEGNAAASGTRFVWIPPGRKSALERPTDRARFAPWSGIPARQLELETIARELCAERSLDAFAADIPNCAAPRFDTLTYIERRGAKPAFLSETVRVDFWRTFIREADDVWARRQQSAVWADEARSRAPSPPSGGEGRGEGVSQQTPSSRSASLTPTLSPQGRGEGGQAPSAAPLAHGKTPSTHGGASA